MKALIGAPPTTFLSLACERYIDRLFAVRHCGHFKAPMAINRLNIASISTFLKCYSIVAKILKLASTNFDNFIDTQVLDVLTNLSNVHLDIFHSVSFGSSEHSRE